MPATGKPRQGRLQKAYYDADGDIATPMWIELGKIQGGGKTSQRDVSEIKERDLDETLVLLGHKSRELTLQLTRRPGQADFNALQDAYENGTKIGFAMVTGDITDSGQRGWQGEVYVTGWDDDQSHDGTVISVTIRLAADYDTAPDVVEVV